MNILFLGISFFLPGRIGFVDTYSLLLEKGVIELLDKKGSRPNEWRNRTDPFTGNAISYEELRPYLDTLKPGTLFFSDHGRAVSAKFIAGSWKHCGIYLGSLDQIQSFWGKDHALVLSLRKYYTSEEDYLIFDSSYEYGVAIHNIKHLANLSEISTLRSLLFVESKLGKEEWSQRLDKGMEHVGKEYDYFFVMENDESLYCSEFLYSMLQMDRRQVSPSRKILGRAFLLPSDLLQAILKSRATGGEDISKVILTKKEGQVIYSVAQLPV
jgi:hypothetical protein